MGVEVPLLGRAGLKRSSMKQWGMLREPQEKGSQRNTISLYFSGSPYQVNVGTGMKLLRFKVSQISPGDPSTTSILGKTYRQVLQNQPDGL